MSRDAPSYTPPSKIVPAETLGAVIDAGVYVERARAMLAQAQGQAQRALAEAQAAGYEAGLRQGRADGLNALGEAIAQVRAQLAEVENDLGQLVLDSVERIVGRIEPRDLCHRLIAVALQEARDATAIVIRVPPDEAQMVLEEINASPILTQIKAIRGVEGDPLLKPGEILIETPRGRVHVGLRQQLARLQETVKG